MEKRDLHKLEKILTKAAKDQEFMKKLLSSPKETFEKEGLKFGEKNVVVRVNTKKDMFLVVPKKLPKGLERLNRLPTHPSLPQVSNWIIQQICENGPYHEELEKDPMKVLKKLRVRTPKDVKLHILKNTEDTLNIVVPRKLKNNDELNDIELQAISGGKAQVTTTGKPGTFGFQQVDVDFSHCIFNLGNGIGE